MKNVFQLVVLGCTGGPKDGNLSGYLLSPLKQQEWIAIDAGSLISGMECALKKGSFKTVSFLHPELDPVVEMHTKHLKGYLISHAHLDHVAGLIFNSQIDEPKWIAGIEPTIDNLKNHLFNNKIWPNYGNEGEPPIINRYQYHRLPEKSAAPLPNTAFIVESFRLSHPHDYPSTAFLIGYEGRFFLYFGDTAADANEEQKHLKEVWERIAPLVQEKLLHGIMLECSYPHCEKERVIYGHLETHSMIEELHHLEEIAGCSLQGLKVVVTHRKEGVGKDIDNLELIRNELTSLNDLGIEFLFPEQGNRYLF